MFAFADAEIIRLAKTAFVPVCADDWYQRSRTDAEGRFFKSIYKQGPRTIEADTHQGIYVFTANGELLEFKNAGHDVKTTREQLASGLRKWQRLPADRRRPGGLVIEDHGPLDPVYTRTPPAGGLVVNVHDRILDRTAGGFAKGSGMGTGGDRASRDFLWLTADDVKRLAPRSPRVGQTYAVPDAVTERILRYHLVDNTRGEPDHWGKDQIRRKELTLTVTAVAADGVTLQLDGEALLATDADPRAAERGYEVKLHGELRYVPAKQTFDRFDVAAVGDHWGVGTFTKKGARPGRGLLGIAFGLADPAVPANRVPPQGARDAAGYFGR